jgi:hypothetical protein
MKIVKTNWLETTNSGRSNRVREIWYDSRGKFFIFNNSDEKMSRRDRLKH